MICWLKQTRWTLIGIVLAGIVTDARALDPNRLPSQYVLEQWTTETRFPGGAVNGIAQTADGYLWIGTDRTLLRSKRLLFLAATEMSECRDQAVRERQESSQERSKAGRRNSRWYC